ncbi:hypothetical protein [Streptomyces sp. NPDC047939]|uniref:hypothetical protein n=1 Tax=Streptomyces sp. NPDC047939 TaxID=3155381 RepID=UPI00343DD4EF
MTDPTPAQLHHLANRARDGVALPAEHDALAAGITAMGDRLEQAELDAEQQARHFHTVCGERESYRQAWKDEQKRRAVADAAIERVLSPEAIRAAGEAIGDEALTHLGRDLGTIHVDHIAEAGLRAALDQAQQPTTTEADSCARHAVLTAAIGYPVRCPHCDPTSAPIPATHWTKHLIRHHPEQPTTTEATR